MGGVNSSLIPVTPIPESENISLFEPLTFPKQLNIDIHHDIIEKYVHEEYIPLPQKERHLQLRYLLDDKVAFHALLKNGCNSENEVLLKCWKDVIRYSRIFPCSKSHNDGMKLFITYVVNNTQLSSCILGAETLGGYHEQHVITKMYQDEAVCKNHFSAHRCGNTCDLPDDGFKWLLMKVFLAIDVQIYTPILESEPEFTKKLLSSIAMRNKHGPSVSDYVFESVLGEGSFGIVVLCKKTATGQKFAMKIQEKDEVIKHNSSDTSKISSESVILASCSDSPYIVPLYFALQTNKLACLVLHYCPYGDMEVILNNTSNQVFSNEMSKFYIAELISVVGYLHGKGIIHRDLKPSNILINKDGHILLADFGAAHNDADFENENEKQTDSSQEHVLSVNDIWKPSWFTGMGKNKYSLKSKKKRRKSRKFALSKEKDPKTFLVSSNAIVGTDGYMSPEVCYLHALPMIQRNIVSSYYNYTKAVDWWGVGAILFYLLTGGRAVSDAQMKQILISYEFTGGALEYKKVIELIGAANSKISVYAADQGSGNSMSAAGSVFLDNCPEAAILEAHPEVVLPQCADFETDGLSKEAISLISSLLDVNFITRLGSGQYGTYNVKADKYFAEFDWKKIDTKQWDPPTDNDKSALSVVNRLTNLVTRGTGAGNVQNTLSPLNGSTSIGSTWIKRLKDYANKNTDIKDNKIQTVENAFNLNFEKLLISIGKEHWIMTPLQLLNSSVSWGNNFSAQERKEFFNDWDYASVDYMLKEIGLSPV